MERYRLTKNHQCEFHGGAALKDCNAFPDLPSIVDTDKEKIDRIIAIGDIHGDLDLAIACMEVADLIERVYEEDKDGSTVTLFYKEEKVKRIYKWIGKRTVVVQVGDQVDRCRPFNHECHIPEATINDEASDVTIMFFYYDLHVAALKADCAVYSLLGNHELLNVLGNMKYVSYKGLIEFPSKTADLAKGRIDAFSLDSKKKVFKDQSSLTEFMGCTRQSSMIVDGYLFVHAGIMERLINYTNKNKKVVEVGCGSGLIASEIIKAGASSYIGYDISEKAIERAIKLSKDNNSEHKTSFYAKPVMDMAEIEADGGFDSHSSVFKTSWNYAGNYNLTNAGDFTETAGSSWITWTDNSSDTTRGNITALAIAPNTGGSAGGVFIYNDQGSGYSPGWRQVWTNTTDGAGSGLDADLLDGQQGSYYASAHSHPYDNYSSWSFNASNTQAIGSGETVTINGSGATSVTNSGNTITVSSTDTNTTYTAGANLSLTGTTFANTAPNIVQTTVSGSSGSCTGNAATATTAANSTLAGGLAVGTGRNNTANQIVRTNAYGYCDFGWINTTSGGASGTPTRIYCSQDSYLRYYTPASLAPYLLNQAF